MNRKKLLYSIGFSCIVLILGFALYWTFFKPTKPITPVINVPITEQPEIPGLPPTYVAPGEIVLPPTVVVPGEEIVLPSDIITPQGQIITLTAQGGITQTARIVPNPVINPSIAGNGISLNYYDPLRSGFFTVDKNGNTIALSDQLFPEVESVVWSPVGNSAVIEFPDGANVIYNFQTEKQITLPKHWEDFHYNTNGTQISFKSYGTGRENNWLAMVDTDGSNAQLIEPMGDNGNKVTINPSPSNQVVAFSNTGRDMELGRQEIYLIGYNGENFKSIIVEGLGFSGIWSLDGSKVLHSVYPADQELKPELWIVDASGENIGNNKKKLNIQTFASKCTFANTETVYCAVPNEMPIGAGPFPEITNRIPDTIYEINVITGQKRILAIPETNMSIAEVFLSEDGNTLYMLNNANYNLFDILIR